MAWEQWVLIAVMVLGSLVNILTIGMRREPVTPRAAVIQIILTIGLIYLIIRL
jgi:hypothetical protein